MPVPRVICTTEAAALIERLRTVHGPLLFHQSGGCCDGSQPMCFPEPEFRIGSIDVRIGDVEGCGYYIARDQYAYWQHTQLILDVTPGRGSSFSLEIPLGVRFYIRSRLFSEEETANLAPVP